ncbi:MAG TPA: PadR family transcriptional regulator [Micromonosporaceae bacterium]|jgi:DNA-binding PadR family transcriptional regulator|nr:PadR family transcriptional regulator [Micromonosporaceae bacterium]
MPDDLPTTSYAVLGLLALRSWTGYELTQQARRSLAFCWQKEESVLYEEPRRLVARGLARSWREREGGRSRNRYEITDEGRTALREWLARSSEPPRPQLEPLLRLTFADQGGVDDALAALSTLREWAVGMQVKGQAMLREYRSGQAPFPDRMHINVLNAVYYMGVLQHAIAFADLAEKEIAAWDRTNGLGMTERTREILDSLIDGG